MGRGFLDPGSEKIADDKIWNYPTVTHHSNTSKFLLNSSSNIRKLDIWYWVISPSVVRQSVLIEIEYLVRFNEGECRCRCPSQVCRSMSYRQLASHRCMNSTIYQSAQIRCHRIYNVKWAKEKKASHKYYCYIQTRAKYSQPSHPVRKEGVLQSCSGDSRGQVKRAPWLAQNVRSIIILCAWKCSS